MSDGTWGQMVEAASAIGAEVEVLVRGVGPGWSRGRIVGHEMRRGYPGLRVELADDLGGVVDVHRLSNLWQPIGGWPGAGGRGEVPRCQQCENLEDEDVELYQLPVHNGVDAFPEEARLCLPCAYLLAEDLSELTASRKPDNKMPFRAREELGKARGILSDLAARECETGILRGKGCKCLPCRARWLVDRQPMLPGIDTR